MPLTQAMREVAQQAIGEDPESSPQPDNTPSSSLAQPSEQEAVKEGESPQPESGQSSLDLTPYEKELISDVGGFDDLDDSAKEKFLAKVKAYDKLVHRAAQDAAEYRRILQATGSVPGLRDAMHDLITKALNGEMTHAQVRQEIQQSQPMQKTLKGFDKYIAKAESADDRETLRDLKTTILEDVSEVVESAIGSLKKEFGDLRESSTTQASSVLQKEVDALEEEGFPAAIVEKYRNGLIAAKRKYPSTSMFKLLLTLADDDETRTLMTPRTPTKRVAQSPATVTGPKKLVDQTKFRRKDGTWNIGQAIRGLASG